MNRTTDQASATFTVDSGGVAKLVVDISRENESDIQIVSASDDDGDTGLTTSATSGLATTGRESGYTTVHVDTNTVFTFGAVNVDWSSSDATDYVAYGAWFNATGDFAAGVVDTASMGAFVDGPEISGTPTLPVTGTAEYLGDVEGMYAALYGTDSTALPADTVELGFFFGGIELTADFGANSISGAVDAIHLIGGAVTPDGSEYLVEGLTGYELELGATPLDSTTGTFFGTDVTLTHPGVSYTTNEGSWGGRFSTKDDSGGNPRLVAGTAGGYAVTSGGTESAFVGAYIGTTDQFE